MSRFTQEACILPHLGSLSLCLSSTVFHLLVVSLPLLLQTLFHNARQDFVSERELASLMGNCPRRNLEDLRRTALLCVNGRIVVTVQLAVLTKRIVHVLR